MTERVEILFKPAGLPVAAQRMRVPAGQTVAEIALAKYGSLDGIEAWLRMPDGAGCLWRAVPRDQWRHVRPRADGVLQFSFRPQGGRAGNVFAVVAAIALAVVAPAIGSFLAPGLITTFGGIGVSTAIGAAVAIGGTLALQKLFPAASDIGGLVGQREKDSAAYADVTSDGNVLAKGAYLPIVVGSRRLAPPDIIQPRAYTRSGVQTIDRAVALWGKHAISAPWVDGTPASSISAITTDICDGDEATGVYGIIEEISATVLVQEQLSTFSLDDTIVEDQVMPSNSSPRWHAFSTPAHEKLEEIAIRIRLDGFMTQTSATEQQRLPLRIRMRERGSSTWINLPEIHIVGREPSTVAKDIRLRWDAVFGARDIGGEIGFEFWREVPAVTAYTLADGSEGATQWEANSYFSLGSGYQDTINIEARRSGVEIVLDEATFPKGAYEFQIMRGLALTAGNLDASYEISSEVESLFVAKRDGEEWVVPVGQGGIFSQVSIPSAMAVADRWPTEWPETAKLELRSRGQSVRNITLQAARYVLDWNGSDAWDSETASSTNPATHYHQILVEWMESRGLDLDLIDNAAFVAWRTECAARGYTCSAVFAGESVMEVLTEIATAGYARPVFGDRFSIDYFRDRSGDDPVQVFGMRNTEAIRFDIVLPERPFGYRASFQNADDSWKDDEIEVTLGGAADIEDWETIAYRAIDDPEEVRLRATFDLLQLDRRRRQWQISTAIEGVVCQPGDMVSIATDLFDDANLSVRVRQALDTSTLVIDQIIPGSDAPAWGDSPAVADILSVGQSSILFLQTPDGVVARTISGVSGNVITLSSALDAIDDLAGSPANIVTETNALHRVIVTRIEPQAEERAILTCVDEAPEIWTEMERLRG